MVVDEREEHDVGHPRTLASSPTFIAFDHTVTILLFTSLHSLQWAFILFGDRGVGGVWS